VRGIFLKQVMRITIILALFFCTIIYCSCGSKNPHVVISTNYGNIEAELFQKQAPKSVVAFLDYVDTGLYNQSSFYRQTFMESTISDNNTGVIQGGIWQSNNAKALQLKGIPHEPTSQTGLSHTNGTLSLARGVPGTANSEFFICIGDQTGYDGTDKTLNEDGQGYAAFGRVVSGMDIVHQIHNQPATGALFTRPIIILSIKRK
jgi:peptidyl-prolyl cis-trans isomerase A (cyclophilin A)